jgi:hypothetical protein
MPLTLVAGWYFSLQEALLLELPDEAHPTKATEVTIKIVDKNFMGVVLVN